MRFRPMDGMVYCCFYQIDSHKVLPKVAAYFYSQKIMLYLKESVNVLTSLSVMFLDVHFFFLWYLNLKLYLLLSHGFVQIFSNSQTLQQLAL